MEYQKHTRLKIIKTSPFINLHQGPSSQIISLALTILTLLLKESASDIQGVQELVRR